jgi:hypothetical protein
MVEIRFDTKETAKSVRRAFVEKMKKGEQFGKLHIANSVTLATRVRVEILRAIAKQFTVSGSEEMYVVGYNSRPVMHIKTSETTKPHTLTFADAITRYGKKLNLENLDEAYRKAGKAFGGQLSQNFVVLTDNKEEVSAVSSTDPKNQGKKRPLIDQQVLFNRDVAAGSSRGSGGRGGRGGRGAKSFRK